MENYAALHRKADRKHCIVSNETPIYDLKTLSAKLNIGIRTLRKYIQRGELRAKKVGKAYYVTEPNLMRFLDPERS